MKRLVMPALGIGDRVSTWSYAAYEFQRGIIESFVPKTNKAYVVVAYDNGERREVEFKNLCDIETGAR